MIRIVDSEKTYDISDAMFIAQIFGVLPQSLKSAVIRALIEYHDSEVAKAPGDPPLREHDPIVTIQVGRVITGNGPHL